MVDFLLQLRLLLLVLTVLARLLALNLPLQVLDVQVLLNLSLILLTLELGHFLNVIFLLTLIVVLKLLLGGGRLLDIRGQSTLLFLQEIILLKLVTLIVDEAGEVGVRQVAHHFFDDLISRLDQRLLMPFNLLLVALNGWFLLQLSAQLFRAILELFGDALDRIRVIR